MKITRLDKIIENNVTYSTQKGNQDQIIFILQDISTTLAMIYDRICGEDPVSEASESVSVMAYVIPFEELKNHDKMHFDHIEFPQGYEVSFLRYEENEIIDVKRNEKRNERYVIVDAFGHEMKLDEKEYGIKWRCWNIEPNKEERAKAKWKK